MNFLISLKTCFKKYIDFKGRASRSEFWYFLLFLVLSFFSMLLISNYWNNSNLFYELSDVLYSTIDYLIDGIFYGLLIICLMPLVSVTIRRTHDIGLSGFVILIFVFGFFIAFILKNEIIVRIVFIVLGLFLMKKSAGKNQFGPVPKK
jgi:uncharacterized membrane protein YhaH (DUF805 family)|tara:strand:- start:581 stop:1024 length:444 start_codon:yes stop_codon:yes gene_type:complete